MTLNCDNDSKELVMSPSVCLIIRSDNSLEFETPIPDWDRSATA